MSYHIDHNKSITIAKGLTFPAVIEDIQYSPITCTFTLTKQLYSPTGALSASLTL